MGTDAIFFYNYGMDFHKILKHILHRAHSISPLSPLSTISNSVVPFFNEITQ